MIVSPNYSVQSSPHAATFGLMFCANFWGITPAIAIWGAKAIQMVQESILRYLVTTGQMRIGARARLKPIPGMVIGTTSTLSDQQASASE